MTTLIVVGVIVVVLLFVVVGAYNRLVALDQSANQSFADIDVQLKQRQPDLIPNLVDTVKGYATHEKSTLDARDPGARQCGDLGGTPLVNDKVRPISVGNMLSGRVLGKLFALSEAYPDLKANTNFLVSCIVAVPVGHREQAGRRAPLLQQRRQRVQRGASPVPDRPVEGARTCSPIWLRTSRSSTSGKASGPRCRPPRSQGQPS